MQKPPSVGALDGLAQIPFRDAPEDDTISHP